MKTILLFLLALPAMGMAQPYPIPGAQKQPAWVFPIWFENANGEKDTIYLGYDRTANGFLGGSDMVFGEKRTSLTTSKFNVYWCSSLHDTAYKVTVSKLINHSQCGDAFFEINATQGWLPMKMSWDVNLFHSDSLPYPDQGTAQRAEGLIWMNGIAVTEPHDDLGCSSFGDHPVLVTDSISIPGGALATCVRRDSIVFTELYSLAFEVRPWSGRWLSVEENEHTGPTINISPNPFTDRAILSIEGSGEGRNNYEVYVYNSIGQKVIDLKMVNGRTEIDRNGMPGGIYFYAIIDNNKLLHSGEFTIQ